MKRIIVLLVIFFLMFSLFGYSDAQKDDSKSGRNSGSPEIITKSYILKHISPDTVERTLREYFIRVSYDQTGGNMMTVKIYKENIVRFEEMLRQLDVEKRKILFRIFTIIASKDNKPSDIPGKELKMVLNELQKVLSFNSFRLDGVSAITVMDGQYRSSLMLTSQAPLMFLMERLAIQGTSPGARSVKFEFRLSQRIEYPISTGKESTQVYENTLIQSETSVKENGYLVAGVSKIGRNGDSLVLIINAEIK
jgi:hypothetical protein